MSDESKFKKFVNKIKSIKHIELIFAAVIIIIMLVIYFSTLLPSAPKSGNSAVETKRDYCERMVSDIEEAVEAMCGGHAKVVINWESSVETILAQITGNGSSSPQLVTDGGITKPIVVKELYPKALGVIIICKGGEKVKLKLDIISAVSVLLDITPDKINVFPIK